MSFNYSIHISKGTSFETKNYSSKDPILTSEQIIEKADKHPAEEHILLHVENDGMLEDLNLREDIDISQKEEVFYLFKNDQTYNLELNGRRYPWGSSSINESALRMIGNIPDNQSLWQEKSSTADTKITENVAVSLECTGVEKIYSKIQEWKLKVNGVTIKSNTQCILASDAITEAGFNANEDWIIILRTKGKPKQEIKITDNIDLSQSGIEKLRIVQKEINNGDMGWAEFSLLDKDIDYLNKSEIQFETILDGAKRWLILLDYKLPKGFNHTTTNIAIMVPVSYPTALLDMFYCYPHLTTESGASIPTTQARVNIVGKSYQRWSRHLGNSRPWNPSTDSVMTHLALIEESLLREVEK